MRILSDARIDFLRTHYAEKPAEAPLFGYSTVRDFCASYDSLPELATAQGDLKDVQRPWAVKTILSHVPIGAHVVEIGAGEPLVAQALLDLGYRVTIVDPYDGSGQGPESYDEFVRDYPGITFVRTRFGPRALDVSVGQPQAVYSVSVLEHVGDIGLESIFAGIAEVLAPGGLSLHCYDFIVAGNGSAYNQDLAAGVGAHQARLQGVDPVRASAVYGRVTRSIRTDLDAYFLSAGAHNMWRGTIPYDDFPYRRVASLTTAARRNA